MSSFDPTSNFDDAWVANLLQRNPVTVMPPGAPNEGNIRLCPGRLSFPSLFEASAYDDDGKKKFQTRYLFPLPANLDTLKAEITKTALAKWPNLGQPGGLQVNQISLPLRDQREKAHLEGFVPGAFFITPGTERRPPIVDMHGAPIAQEHRVYPGVWAMLTVRPYAYEYRKTSNGPVMKYGVGLGLQSVMILVDDKQLGGGGGDPTHDFAGVNVEGLGPAVDPAGMFGASGAQAQDPLAAAAQSAAQPQQDPRLAQLLALGLTPEQAAAALAAQGAPPAAQASTSAPVKLF